MVFVFFGFFLVFKKRQISTHIFLSLKEVLTNW